MPTQMYEFAVTSVNFAVDTERRIVEGLILPFGELSSRKGGFKFRFRKGSVSWSDVSRIKMTKDHISAEGVALELSEKRDGLYGKFRVARGAAGDDLLQLAEDKVYDGFSVTVDFDTSVDATPDNRERDVFNVHRSELREVALTAMPSFDSARVTRVAASRNVRENAMPDEPENPVTPVAPEPPAQVPVQNDIPLLQFAGNDVPDQVMLSVEGGSEPVRFTRTPVGEQRQAVNPARPVGTLQVRDPQTYQFSRNGDLVPGAHDFGIDFVRAMNPQFADRASYDRVLRFMQAHFNETSAQTQAALNPILTLPRFVDEREFIYPMYQAFNRGTPPNGIQPFQWPKFVAVTGYVDDHTEGVEPTVGGPYQATMQTVTPSPLSGKAKITRETWDMGGTPGLSDLIWRRIRREWFENLEAAISATLTADVANITSLGVLTAGGGTGHATLVQELRRYIARLQFARGGFRFDQAFAHQGLYEHLADSFDSTGRPFFPVQGPQNADGTSASRWAAIDVGGVPFRPTWVLGSDVSVTGTSWLTDTNEAADVWATEPMRLTFDETEVAHVYLGAWGYKASAVRDRAGIRKILYDAVP